MTTIVSLKLDTLHIFDGGAEPAANCRGRGGRVADDMRQVGTLCNFDNYGLSDTSTLAMDKARTLATLPPELLTEVFHCLDTKSLRAVATTCRALRRTAVPVLWANPIIPSQPPITLERLIQQYGVHIRSLSFPDPTYIDLVSVAPYLCGLLRIDLGGCAPFTVGDQQVMSLIACCPLLVAIDLRDCIDITDATLFALAKHPNVKFLEELSLARCCEVTDAGIAAIVRAANGLKTLNVTCVPCLSETALHHVAKECSNLRVLIARDSDAVSDEVLLELASGCPKLTQLDVDECLGVTEKGLLQFAQVRQDRLDEAQKFGLPDVAGSLSLLKLNGTASDAITDHSLIALLPPIDSKRAGTSICRPRLDTLELAFARHITATTFTHLAKNYAHQLTRLNLSNATISDMLSTASRTLSDFLSVQPHIRHLNLMGAVELVDDASCQVIGQTLTELETLDLSECRQLTDEGTVTIARGCTKLIDVNLKGCTELGDATVRAFVEDGSAALRVLNVGLCSRVTDESVGSLASLYTKPGGGLHTLKLSGCFNLTDAALEQFINLAPTPKSTPHPLMPLSLLCLSGCYHITDNSLARLTPHLHSLESINFYSCEGVTDATVKVIAEHCPRLQSLVMSKCRITDEGFEAIGQRCSRLHTLYAGFLSGDGPSNSGISSVLGGCKELKLLDISRCEKISDLAFGGDGMLQVQVLMVRCCPRVTFTGLAGFVERCPRLQKVDITGCCGISVEEKNQLKELVDGRW
ncbi:uncharacterized protein SPPG_04919 [Spizellomyces punctatus DAOM BR117]|uniref:F-box domain-containing protein n=1 Tax=Spizellomyces punctatus (strain DAOM BR117) TaxID=645134 RepID=A0A0L0HFG1_SPIPD|nr:uncharacterized protein SPPG_04919 [Spizellomyces punctatus DAOM BR117]KNC99528.1 hypothetical protein SPPG_04919 [Spizellomyces punctatus DAOM BR117]|eukprot:XP_016607568.1 hypothetical protein SPPG_04919 [Spizellomyces punctatus DAOM BR117]